MSYVIQNFYSVNHALILNQKLYWIWLHRNNNLILTFLVRNWTHGFSNLNYLTNVQMLFTLNLLFFNNSFYQIYKTLLTKWNQFWVTNYVKSLQYWTLIGSHRLISKQSIRTELLVLHEDLFFNQYFTNVVVSNISLHNKYYRNVLLKFILLLVSPWQLWNRHYNISLKFMLISKNFHLIRFYNSYFFKMYNF